MRAIPSILFVVAASGSLLAFAASAKAFNFSTNGPDGKIAMATNPSSAGVTERETGDDFILKSPTAIQQATFTGLITGNFSIGDVVTEIYRVFPNDSDPLRTINVPTRKNSPSDVAFESLDFLSKDFSFTETLLDNQFTANNSVLNGINPKPNFFTGGEGPVTGREVKFTITYTTPLDLPADHYFFVPQVEVTGGQFYWLSAPKPIVPPGTPINPDLQTWIRNEALQPDWLRVGTDIVGGDAANLQPQFNAAFSLAGVEIPESNSLWLIAAAAAIGVFVVRRTRRPAA